jgi:hypothetical protein
MAKIKLTANARLSGLKPKGEYIEPGEEFTIDDKTAKKLTESNPPMAKAVKKPEPDTEE